MSKVPILDGHRPRWAERTASALRFLLAIAFAAAGAAKLAGVPAMIEVFDAIGLGQWLRLVTGSVEIAGAALLAVSGTAGLGAALLTPVMAVAVLTHLVWIGGNPVPAIALFLLSAFVLWVRSGEVTRLLGGDREATA